MWDKMLISPLGGACDLSHEKNRRTFSSIDATHWMTDKTARHNQLRSRQNNHPMKTKINSLAIVATAIVTMAAAAEPDMQIEAQAIQHENGTVTAQGNVQITKNGKTIKTDQAVLVPGSKAPMIAISAWCLDLGPEAMRKVFGEQGPQAGNAFDLKALNETAGISLLSAPTFTTQAGQSAKIELGKEQTFTINYRISEKTGGWEPVQKTVKLGLSMTVMAMQSPQNPDRLQGAAEITFSELMHLHEQIVTPPGSQGTLRLQSPVVETRYLTFSFDMERGKPTVIGAFQGAGSALDSRKPLASNPGSLPATERAEAHKALLILQADPVQ